MFLYSLWKKITKYIRYSEKIGYWIFHTVSHAMLQYNSNYRQYLVDIMQSYISTQVSSLCQHIVWKKIVLVFHVFFSGLYCWIKNSYWIAIYFWIYKNIASSFFFFFYIKPGKQKKSCLLDVVQSKNSNKKVEKKWFWHYNFMQFHTFLIILTQGTSPYPH